MNSSTEVDIAPARDRSLKKSLLVPLAVFVLLVLFLGLGFQLKDPHLLPSALIDQPFPSFSLHDLHEQGVMRTQDELSGQVSLVNVWATWCPNCLIEHPELMRVAQEENVPIYGVNYNDDSVKARAWLKRHSDPYRFSIVDDEGRLAIDLGVYGAPETFIVDHMGTIRFRYVGPVTPDVWQKQLQPVVELLRAQANQASGEAL